MKINKSKLKKIIRVSIFIILISLICYTISSSIKSYKDKRVQEEAIIRNAYCNTTWQDYINNEVVNQTTEFIVNNCKCYYENQYTLDQLESMCLCSCELYELNGTPITNEFKSLFSLIK